MFKMGLSLYITLAAILNVALGITINEPKINDFQKAMQLMTQISALNERRLRDVEKDHPLVRQTDPGTGDTTDEGRGKQILDAASDVNSTVGGILAEVDGNRTNILGYPFQYYDPYTDVRNNWVAFLAGANSSHYAPNASVCFSNAMNLI